MNDAAPHTSTAIPADDTAIAEVIPITRTSNAEIKLTGAAFASPTDTTTCIMITGTSMVPALTNWAG